MGKRVENKSKKKCLKTIASFKTLSCQNTLRNPLIKNWSQLVSPNRIRLSLESIVLQLLTRSSKLKKEHTKKKRPYAFTTTRKFKEPKIRAAH